MKAGIIESHNVKQAAAWNSGGRSYEAISYTISDAIEHCLIRLAPRPGERLLDVATGTGWAARRASSMGASVTGIDLGEDLIETAKSQAAQSGLSIDFQVGDAEKLSFENESFDAVLSTFGVMFVQRPEAAAAELARVCRKGGRLGLLTWLPDSTIAGFFKVMKKHMIAPSNPAPSPFEWGDRNRVTQLLGPSFELRFETGVTYMRAENGQAVWDLFVTGYGPTKTLAANLDEAHRESLKRDFISFHEQYRTELGIAMPREYMVTVGVRK